MYSRWVVVPGIVALGLLAPLAPRLTAALTDPRAAEHFAAWMARSQSVRALRDWTYVVSPFLLLALLSALTLRRGVAPRARVVIARRLWVTAVAALVLGLYLCKPVAGQGMSFYFGELIFPFAAVPAMAVAYLLSCLVLRRRAALVQPAAPEAVAPVPQSAVHR